LSKASFCIAITTCKLKKNKLQKLSKKNFPPSAVYCQQPAKKIIILEKILEKKI